MWIVTAVRHHDAWSVVGWRLRYIGGSNNKAYVNMIDKFYAILHDSVYPTWI